MKKFSIIIPAYNAEKELEKCLNSIFIQDYKNYEVIVIDDKSTDNTAKIAEKFPEVILIRHEVNKRAGGARNTGIERAEGEYVIFLDSDDYLASSNVLGRLNEVIGEDKPDIVYTGFEAVGEAFTGTFIPTEENSVKEERLKTWRYENVWDICWRREFLNRNNIRFIEGRFYEDFVFYLRGVLVSETYKVASFPVHIYYSGRPESMTNNITYQKMEDFYYNMIELFKLYGETKEEYKIYVADMARRNNIYANKLLDILK